MFNINHRLTKRCVQEKFFKSEKEKEGWTRKDREENVYIPVRQMKSSYFQLGGQRRTL